jgi:hypothetical protein
MPADPSLDISSLVTHVLHRQLQLPEFSQPVYIDDAQAIDTMVILSVRTATLAPGRHPAITRSSSARLRTDTSLEGN